MKYKQNRGVTLIALAVTIIVMLILAGATISILSGDSGIITNAKKSKKANEIASAEEEAKMLYLQKLQESQMNDEETPTLADIKEDLENKGYKIKTGLKVDGDGTTPISGIKLSSKSVILGQGNTQNVEMTFEGGYIGENYLNIGDEYYLISLADKKISISRESSKITDVVPVPANIIVTSSNSEAIDVKINGADITITGKGITSSTEKVMVKNGEQILAECKVMVLSTSDMKNVVEAKDIANSADKTEYYGKKVTNYQSNVEGIGYQIFHADNENIYLITETCLSDVTQAPKKENKGLDKGKTQPCIISKDLANKYTNGIGTIANKSQGVLKKWLGKYLNNENANTSLGSKAVAYMMDTEIWNPLYVVDGIADYAIGGPTIEMIRDSWNSIATEDKKISCDVTSTISTGYGVKWAKDTNYLEYLADFKPDKCTTIYKANTNNLAGIFVASTTPEGDECIFILNNQWGLCGPGYDVDAKYGFRPIICLNKETKLLKTSDGLKVLGI